MSHGFDVAGSDDEDGASAVVKDSAVLSYRAISLASFEWPFFDGFTGPLVPGPYILR